MHPYFAQEGYCFASFDESNIFYDCIWVKNEEDVYKNFKIITLNKAKEIVKKYKEKYAHVY